MPVAEAAGLIGELFDRVLEESLQAHARWTRTADIRSAISVNLSARQLDDPSLPGAVAVALTRSGRGPHRPVARGDRDGPVERGELEHVGANGRWTGPGTADAWRVRPTTAA